MQVVLALQEGESLNAVDSNVQIDSGVGDAEGLFRQADVTGTVFNQQDIHWPTTVEPNFFHYFLCVRKTGPVAARLTTSAPCRAHTIRPQGLGLLRGSG